VPTLMRRKLKPQTAESTANRMRQSRERRRTAPAGVPVGAGEGEEEGADGVLEGRAVLMASTIAAGIS
jgi:hypothetical protein